MVERALPQRAKESVVDRDRAAVRVEVGIACRFHRFDIDQRIGRVARAFEVNQRDLAVLCLGLSLGLGHDRVELFGRRTGREIDIGHPVFGHDLRDEAFRRGIERPGMDYHITRRARGQHQDCDRGHPAGKAQGFFRSVPDCQAILQNFLVRRVETRIDEALRAAFALAGNAFEVSLACSCILERERAGEEDRRLQRTFR